MKIVSLFVNTRLKVNAVKEFIGSEDQDCVLTFFSARGTNIALKKICLEIL